MGIGHGLRRMGLSSSITGEGRGGTSWCWEGNKRKKGFMKNNIPVGIDSVGLKIKSTVTLLSIWVS